MSAQATSLRTCNRSREAWVIENSDDERYGAVAIFFHWATASLVLAAVLCAWGIRLAPSWALQSNLLIVHRSFGMSVLVVAALRVVWRASHPALLLPSSVRRWQRWLAAGTHWLLYGLLFAMPIAGYLSTTAAGHAVSFFYLFEIPRLIAHHPALARLAGRTHRSLQWAIYFFVALHAAAALGHHFVIKDHVLRRMLPALPLRSPANLLRRDRAARSHVLDSLAIFRDRALSSLKLFGPPFATNPITWRRIRARRDPIS
jgi:cytochrome b561